MRNLSTLVVLFLFSFSVIAQNKSLHIEDLTWPEVRDAIASGKTTAIIYSGSTEQNGPHMALGKHNFIARHVGERIAATLGNALVYPILPFAPTGEPVAKTDHMRFPGSISVSEATFGAVIREFAQSAIAAGFKHVALMGDHGGGQDTLARIARDLDSEWAAKGIRVQYVADLYVKSNEQVTSFLAQRKLSPGQHAGLSDTAELMAIDTQRRWIRRDKLTTGNPENGIEGDPRLATAQLGRRFIQFKIDTAVAQIRSLPRLNQ